jgi:hypothetical protein
MEKTDPLRLRVTIPVLEEFIQWQCAIKIGFAVT